MTHSRCQQNKSLNPLIKGIMDENNSLKLEILNHLIYLSTRFKFVFISQGTLAAKFNVTRQWINTLLAQWKALGVIKYRQQDFNRSCIYLINPLLTQEKNRIRFKLPAVMLLLSISSLFSAVFQQELTLNNIRKYIYENSYRVVAIKNAVPAFYEPRCSKKNQEATFLFIKSGTAPSKQVPYLESSMEQRAVIQLLADAYGLTKQQEEMLCAFSDNALEHAVKELSKQQGITSPVNWITAVARTFDAKARRYPQTGRLNNFQQKIVHGSFNANHSPSKETPKMTDNERIGFLVKEVAAFKEKIANPQNYFLPNVDIPAALEVGRALLAAREYELAELLNPPVKIIDKAESDMSPTEWLIWNRDRKIRSLKEKYHGTTN